jgi:urea transport system permease protein
MTTASMGLGAATDRLLREPMFPLWSTVGTGVVVAILATYPLYGTEYVMNLLGMFVCFSIFALSISLIWGFAGILSLGQAIYFGMGAYFIAISLKLSYAAVNPTRYGGTIPDYMEWNGLEEVPTIMAPLMHIEVAIVCALFFPTLLAFIFGVITFKRHIYGVYCAVITLAEALILQEFIIEYQVYTGGFNGITDYETYNDMYFLWAILGVAVLLFGATRLLTHSRIGTVLKSVRDNDVRAEFNGYEVANYRIFVFCFASTMASIAGGFYAAWMGIVSHLDAGPMLSIEGVIWAAVGGRATVIGAFIGTFLVKGAEFFLSEQLAWAWQLVMGLLFIFVVKFMPDGLMGTIGKSMADRRRRIAFAESGGAFQAESMTVVERVRAVFAGGDRSFMDNLLGRDGRRD